VLGIVFYLLLLDRPPRISWWIAYGLFWGVVALTNTTLVLMMPFALAALLVRWGRPARKCALAAILVFGCALVPWTVRNYVVFHKVIPVRGNFGAILWCGNRPDVKGPCDESMNAIQNLTERQAYLRLGDAEYVASRQRMALEFIAQNPGRFLELTRNRIVNFWAAAGREEAKLGLVASWSALAFAGLIGMLRKRPLISVPFAAALLLYPLPYYVTLACTFYRYPINPVVDLLAIYACATAGSWLLLRLQTRQV